MKSDGVTCRSNGVTLALVCGESLSQSNIYCCVYPNVQVQTAATQTAAAVAARDALRSGACEVAAGTCVGSHWWRKQVIDCAT